MTMEMRIKNPILRTCTTSCRMSASRSHRTRLFHKRKKVRRKQVLRHRMRFHLRILPRRMMTLTKEHRVKTPLPKGKGLGQEREGNQDHVTRGPEEPGDLLQEGTKGTGQGKEEQGPTPAVPAATCPGKCTLGCAFKFFMMFSMI